MKTCTGCKETKSLDLFHKLSESKDGRQPKCKACRKNYYSATAEHQKDKFGVWYLNNKDKARETRKAYLETEAGRLKVKSLKSARRARERGARVDGQTLNDSYFVLYSYFGEMCMFPNCSVTTDIHIDHIVPISLGGLHVYDNFQLLCVHHNTSKGNRGTDDYRPVQMTNKDIEELLVSI